MKTTILSLAVCLFSAIPSKADSKPFDAIPRDHWSISAVQLLVKCGVSEATSTNSPSKRTLTRYDLAVVAARVVDKFGYNPKFASDKDVYSPGVRDILVALLYEYRDEYMMLSVTDPMTTGRWEIEAYFRAKEKYRALNASQWYIYAQSRPWIKDIISPVSMVPRLQSFKPTPNQNHVD